MVRAGPAILVILALLLSASAASAQRRGGGGSGPPPIRGDFGAALPAPGLNATFANGTICTPIASPYGSPTRYDGSQRMTGGAGGLHGGIDLTLTEGTPLHAIAPGQILGQGEGGMMEGIYLWLLHLPQHTGLAYGFLSKYQHLAERPVLANGTSVGLGQVIAKAGRTGTVGGYYGGQGYPHLHLTVRSILPEKLAAAAAAGLGGDDFRVNRDSVIVDPLTIYVPDLQSPADAASLPLDRKTVIVGYVDQGGKLQLGPAKFVWPVACP